jgi:hypothetical protein
MRFGRRTRIMSIVHAPPVSASGPTRPALGTQEVKRGVLAGPAFELRTRTQPTADGGTAGRWVAADESGWNGEALFQPDEPYMVIGCVAVDDATAAEVGRVAAPGCPAADRR